MDKSQNRNDAAPPQHKVSGLIENLVAICTRRAPLVALTGLILVGLALAFTVLNFRLSSDTQQLLSKSLAWRQREATYDQLFNPEGDQIVTVIDGKTPELAEMAAAHLTEKLKDRPDLFRYVSRPDGGEFFGQNGLLFESQNEVRNDLNQLISAQPFLGPLAADPSLRGLTTTLSTALQGVSANEAKLEDLNPALIAVGDAVDKVRAGKPAFFSWRNLIAGKAPDKRELRRLILSTPVFDYAKLQSSEDAEDYIRKTAKGLQLTPENGVSVRLTGPAPLQDEEFATLGDRAALIGALAFAAIVAMLWMAVRNVRLILAILATTLVGLVCAAAVGLAVFHRFNVISVAFIPLFVGLGIDFGIQFSVRFRAEQEEQPDLDSALRAAGAGMGRSLTLAAAAISMGFLAFAPTAYVGVSQLGTIAGLGMIIALILNLTLLPALIHLLKPAHGAPDSAADLLAGIDGFVLGHRRLVIGTALGMAAVCGALLPWLHFDFNPLHLKSARTESVSTALDLMRDPDLTPNTLEVVTPSLAAAQALGEKISALPTVDQVRTIASFVPEDQAPKLAAITDAATLLDLTLDPFMTAPDPTDEEIVAGLTKTAADLRSAAATAPGRPASANALTLADKFEWLASKADAATRARLQTAVMTPLGTVLTQTREALKAHAVTQNSLPDELKRDWLAPDGRARLSIVPKGDANNNAVIERFIGQVMRIAPDATGTPFDTQQAGAAVAGAFGEAGVLSFVVITALLFAVLRRVRDVAITMAPIVLTGLLTLGTCVVIGQPLNFANIIALPLLFGIGVAFHIYFVMAWRSGNGHLLQSSLTRAIFFSALATATGFGSLWASSHPGTASMGMLLMISLIWTLVSALLFQPALMGPAPEDRG